jgi:hypothetical protein
MGGFFAISGLVSLCSPPLGHQTQKTTQGGLVRRPIAFCIHAGATIKLGGHRRRFLTGTPQPLQGNGDFR